MNSLERLTPTIKGMFVMSHVHALKKALGDAAVVELERRLGRPIAFSPFDDVPVKDEVALLEHCIAIANPALPEEQRAFEAGRLHFRNFTTTPYGKIIFSQFKHQFKMLMMRSPSIAGHVFRSVQFSSRDLGERGVEVTMKNNDYPLDHFRGLFQEWMEYAGLRGTVAARQADSNDYVYTMQWE